MTLQTRRYHMQTIGKITATHTAIEPNFKQWGLGTLKDEPSINLLETLNSIPEEVFKITKQLFSDADYRCVTASIVDIDTLTETPIQGYHLRFQKLVSSTSIALYQEHISLLIDTKSYKLLGFTQQTQQSPAFLPTHEHAFNTATQFLKQWAPDLLQQNPSLNLSACEPEQRLEFNPVHTLDNLEMQWIDQHHESILVNNIKTSVTGMKVKFYIPSSDRWAWVIVDGNQNVITFERDIKWDFKQHIRLTPMWLHDAWLAVAIKLDNECK